MRPEYDFASMKGGIRGKYAPAPRPASRERKRQTKSGKRTHAARG